VGEGEEGSLQAYFETFVFYHIIFSLSAT